MVSPVYRLPNNAKSFGFRNYGDVCALDRIEAKANEKNHHQPRHQGHGDLPADCSEFLWRDHLTQLEIKLHPGGGNPLHHHWKSSPPSTANWACGSEGRSGRSCNRASPSSLRLAPSTRSLTPTDHDIRFGVEVEPASERLENFLRVMYGLASE